MRLVALWSSLLKNIACYRVNNSSGRKFGANLTRGPLTSKELEELEVDG